MDKIDLEELERLAKAATPGPWKVGEGHSAKFVMTYEDIPVRRLVSVIDGDKGTCDLARGWDESCANAAYIVAACNAAPELIARVRELEERIAELTQENSGHKRVIHILENKVLALKGKPIPMEPRQFIPSSNRSNAKEAGE